jgi:hypothetical protein
VWGQRIPRTNEFRARAAYNDFQDEVARMGDPSPLLLHERFLTEVRVALASVDARVKQNAGEAADAASWFQDQVQTALLAHDDLMPSWRPPGPEYQGFLNRLICSLVEGLSPLQADLMNIDEVRTLLHDLHYPGFWTPEGGEAESGKAPTATETTTPTPSPTGSTSKRRSRA